MRDVVSAKPAGLVDAREQRTQPSGSGDGVVVEKRDEAAARVARTPALFPPAKPRFSGERDELHPRVSLTRINSAVPSVDPLSTMMVSAADTAAPRRRRGRYRDAAARSTSR